MDEAPLENSEAFAKHLVQLLVERGLIAADKIDAAYAVVADVFFDEQDAGTVEFHEPPNWRDL